MPRNTSQQWIATAGNPAQAGTNIDPAVHNATIADLGAEISNSLMRDGNGTMTGQFKAVPGSTTAPGISFVGDTDTGFSNAAGDFAIVYNGVKIGAINLAGLNLLKGLVVSTDANVNQALSVTAPAAATATVGARKPAIRAAGNGAYKPGIEASNDPGGWAVNVSSGTVHVSPAGSIVGGNSSTRNTIQANTIVQMKATIDFDAFGGVTFRDNLNIAGAVLGSDYVQLNFQNDMGSSPYFPLAANLTGVGNVQWVPNGMSNTYMQFQLRNTSTNALQSLVGPMAFSAIIFGACPE